MSGRAHVVIIIGAVLTIAFIVRLLRRHQLRSKYSLLWILIAAVIGVLGAYPDLLDRTSHALGIYYPPAFLLLIAVGFLFLVVVQFSWEFSRSDDRLRRLAEEHALLRAQVDGLRSVIDGIAAPDLDGDHVTQGSVAEDPGSSSQDPAATEIVDAGSSDSGTSTAPAD